MFKLIKLAFYGFIGYALYEFVLGLVEGEGIIQSAQDGQRQRQGRGREFNRAADRDRGRGQNITGPARGQTVTTSESSGESVPHVVGRGVVSK